MSARRGPSPEAGADHPSDGGDPIAVYNALLEDEGLAAASEERLRERQERAMLGRSPSRSGPTC